MLRSRKCGFSITFKKNYLQERSNAGAFSAWHTHAVQSSVFIHSPQQSPPSYKHPAVLASSLQNPLPIKANGAAQLRSSKHMHSVQYCVSTFDPQQSPPSKWHPSLFVASSHCPSPTQRGLLEQPVDLNMYHDCFSLIRFFLHYKVVWLVEAVSRDIHIECSKQFKWKLYFYRSGQRGPFWAELKLL